MGRPPRAATGAAGLGARGSGLGGPAEPAADSEPAAKATEADAGRPWRQRWRGKREPPGMFSHETGPHGADQMAVSCYLKRRQYGDADGPVKQGLRLSQSTEEMAASLTGTLPFSQRQQLAQVPL